MTASDPKRTRWSDSKLLVTTGFSQNQEVRFIHLLWSMHFPKNLLELGIPDAAITHVTRQDQE